MSSQDIASHPPVEGGETPDSAVVENLFKSAMHGMWKEAAEIYAQNRNVRETKITWVGDTLLHLATSSGVEDNVMLFLACLEKEDVGYRHMILEIKNDREDTALHIAAALGLEDVCLAMARLHPEMVVNNRNRRGEAPLFKAVRHGHKKAFFALQSVVETHAVRIPIVRRERTGETILHNALFAEHFDLAWEIIHMHPDLVDAVSERGETPLHVLADMPLAFKSGTRFSLLDSAIYYCIPVNPLKVKYSEYKNKFSKSKNVSSLPSQHNGRQKLPENYQACYNIFTFIKHIFKNIDAVPRLGATDGDPENGAQAHRDASKKQQRYPENYRTCVNFFKLAMKFLIVIFGSTGLQRVQELKANKKKHVFACQIMEELVRRGRVWHYGKDGKKPITTPGGESSSTMLMNKELKEGPPKVTPEPEVKDESKQASSSQNQVQAEILKQLEKCCCKQIEDDSKQKPVGATPILVAAKKGITEIVVKMLEDFPVAAFDLDPDDKNIVLLAVENRQPRVYELMLKRELMRDRVFSAVDKDGNSALHLAARLGNNRPWGIPGAALQMQWEIKWYKYVSNSMGPETFMRHNLRGETAQEIFIKSHEPLVKDAGQWLNNTSQSCSVVAALIATVAFASATTVPGGVNQESGFPIFQGKPAFEVFALSALIALCFSITSLVMFLSILTSRFQERDFDRSLPVKLIVGLTTLFMSIGANLVSFCAGHFFVIEQKLKYAAYPIYAVACLPVSFFAVAQFPLYIDLIRATFAVVPHRTQKSSPF